MTGVGMSTNRGHVRTVVASPWGSVSIWRSAAFDFIAVQRRLDRSGYRRRTTVGGAIRRAEEGMVECLFECREVVGAHRLDRIPSAKTVSYE